MRVMSDTQNLRQAAEARAATQRATYTPLVLEIIKLDWAPLLCLRPIGNPSDQELVDSLQTITGLLEAERRLQRRAVMIVDMRKAEALSAPQRRTASEWMKKNMVLYKQSILAGVFIIDSPVIRGVLTALLWLSPMELPYEVVGNLDEAVRWSIARFDAEHVPIPERLRSELGRAFP